VAEIFDLYDNDQPPSIQENDIILDAMFGKVSTVLQMDLQQG